MIARTLYLALHAAAAGRVLTMEQALTLQWLRAEARVEREVVKRVRKRAKRPKQEILLRAAKGRAA